MSDAREQEEQRHLTLATKALLRVRESPDDPDAYQELWIANDWICAAEERWPGYTVEMALTLLNQDETRLLWAASLMQMLYQSGQRLDRIAEGIPFEHDGITYQALERETIRTLADRT